MTTIPGREIRGMKQDQNCRFRQEQGHRRGGAKIWNLRTSTETSAPGGGGGGGKKSKRTAITDYAGQRRRTVGKGNTGTP